MDLNQLTAADRNTLAEWGGVDELLVYRADELRAGDLLVTPIGVRRLASVKTTRCHPAGFICDQPMVVVSFGLVAKECMVEETGMVYHPDFLCAATRPRLTPEDDDDR